MPYWVGPFLTPTDFDPLADPQPITDAEDVGYISDGVLTTVKGSVFPVAADFNTEPGVPGVANFFRIEGPGVENQPGLQASPDRCLNRALGPLGNRSNCVETNLFSVTGQIASIFGVQPVRTTYTRGTTGTGRIGVLARSVPGQTIQASIPRSDGLLRAISLFDQPLGSGRYFGRFAFNEGSIPLPADRTITLTNLTDNPPTEVPSPLTDVVRVNVATFNTTGLNAGSVPRGTGTLTLRVDSSDSLGGVTLQAFADAKDVAPLMCTADINPRDGIPDDGAVPSSILPDNGQVLCPTFAINKVTATSTGGGKATQDVVITGRIVSGP